MYDLPRNIVFFFSALGIGGGFIAWLRRNATQAQIDKYPPANDNFAEGERDRGEF